MNFVEAFVVPHPYLFTLICLAVLITITNIFSRDCNCSHVEKDNPLDFPQDGM